MSHKEIVHIGDNPFADFIPCKLCNIFSIRVNTHEYKDRIVDPFLDANLIVNDVAEALEYFLGRKEL